MKKSALFFLLTFTPLLMASEQKAKPPSIAPTKTAQLVSETSVSGVNFRNSITQNQSKLILKGAALRSKFFFSVYVLGLYQDEKSPNPTHPDFPRLIRLVLKRDVSQKDMIEALDEGVRKNTTEATRAATAPAMAKLKAMFKDGDFKNGNEVILAYWPKTGLEIKLNGNQKGVINDKNFAKAIFDVWLGEKPVGKQLKRKLLGA